MSIELEKFINRTSPHGLKNSAPPKTPEARHRWESMLLYSVKDKLKEDVVLIDYGCGDPATLKLSLKKRYEKSKYIGLDIKRETLEKDELIDNAFIGNIKHLSRFIETADCIVAGSVLSHLIWEETAKLLNNLKPLFENGGEFGFSFFNGREYSLYGQESEIFYHVVELPIKYLEDYCAINGLKLNLLDYKFNLDHNITYENKIFHSQSFCNIKK